MATWKPLILKGGVPTALPTGDDIGLQPLNALLTAFAGLTPTADQLAYFTGASTISVASLSSFSRTQFANADAATWRTNLAVAPLASPTFTGTPAGPTATVNTNTTQFATTAFVVSQIANDAVLKVGGSTIGDGLTANAALLSFSKNGATTTIASSSVATAYAFNAITGTTVIRNNGDGTTPKPIIIAGSEVHLGVSATTAENYPSALIVTPTTITTTIRPTFAGNLAYDAGNLTPANPPTQLTGATLTNGNNSFWLEEDDNTGEGCLMGAGGIGGIATDYDKVVNLYAKDSNGSKFFIPMLRV